MIRDETEWIDISNSDLDLRTCPDCGDDPAMQVHQGAEGYRVACGCSSARGNTTEEAAGAWNTMMSDVPRDTDGRPKICLRVGVDESGFLYLYDALSGREVARQKGVSLETYQPFPGDELQATVVCVDVHTDPRLLDAEALRAVRHGDGGWTIEEYAEAQNGEENA